MEIKKDYADEWSFFQEGNFILSAWPKKAFLPHHLRERQLERYPSIQIGASTLWGYLLGIACVLAAGGVDRGWGVGEHENSRIQIFRKTPPAPRLWPREE